MSVDITAYNINIRQVHIDDEDLFEARVKELVDVIAYSETANDAYAMAVDAIEATAAHFSEVGKGMPEPSVPADSYSGRVTLRLPKSLHRTVAETAESECISLNQYLVGILSYCSGFSHGQNRLLDGTWFTPERTARPAKKKTDTPRLKLVQVNDSPENRYATNY